jgi:hypothetical protein
VRYLFPLQTGALPLLLPAAALGCFATAVLNE